MLMNAYSGAELTLHSTNENAILSFKRMRTTRHIKMIILCSGQPSNTPGRHIHDAACLRVEMSSATKHAGNTKLLYTALGAQKTQHKLAARTRVPHMLWTVRVYEEK